MSWAAYLLRIQYNRTPNDHTQRRIACRNIILNHEKYDHLAVMCHTVCVFVWCIRIFLRVYRYFFNYSQGRILKVFLNSKFFFGVFSSFLKKIIIFIYFFVSISKKADFSNESFCGAFNRSHELTIILN